MAKQYRQQAIRFQNGEVDLAGVLCLPHGSPPYQAVVFIHGSGPAGRDGLTMFPPMWETFAQRGIASLSWDKPGVGESSGDWRFQSAIDRAQESLAAIQFLQQHPEIDASRIGFWGSSQAGGYQREYWRLHGSAPKGGEPRRNHQSIPRGRSLLVRQPNRWVERDATPVGGTGQGLRAGLPGHNCRVGA